MSAPIGDLAELHDELRSVARDLLTKAEAAPDWRLISRSGWLGLETPDAFDGADATFAEVAVILQEMGRATARCAYPAVAALGVGTLNLLDPGPGRDKLLRETVSGNTVPILALDGEAMGEAPFRIERTPHGQFLHGTAAFVLDASAADRLLLPATESDGTPVIVEVDPRAAGLTVAEQPVLDTTRSFGSIVADGVEVHPDSLWRFHTDPQLALARVRDRAAVAVALDSVGLSLAMLDTTVAYAGVREQFGRKIGSFQAVKHACADMLVQVTVAGKLVDAAVRSLARDEPDAWVAASMAKSFTCTAAVDIAGKAMQLHGGMGYTWESGIHVYLKRAALNRSLFGSPALHRRRLAERYQSSASEPPGA